MKDFQLLRARSLALHHNNISASDVHFVGVAGQRARQLKHRFNFGFWSILFVFFGTFLCCNNFGVTPGVPMCCVKLQ